MNTLFNKLYCIRKYFTHTCTHTNKIPTYMHCIFINKSTDACIYCMYAYLFMNTCLHRIEYTYSYIALYLWMYIHTSMCVYGCVLKLTKMAKQCCLHPSACHINQAKLAMDMSNNCPFGVQQQQIYTKMPLLHSLYVCLCMWK